MPRYLKVEVRKTVATEIYLRVPDGVDIPVKRYLAPGGSTATWVSTPGEWDRVAEREVAKLPDTAFDDPTYEVDSAVEVTEQEAAPFRVVNVQAPASKGGTA